MRSDVNLLMNVCVSFKLTATPCTCAVVPSGNVIMELFGSMWIMDSVPSAFCIVCSMF